jgi:hypothetical protein
MKLSRKEVYDLIDGEREYQEERWHGETSRGKGYHSPEEWLMYIEDYVNEAKHVMSRESYLTATEKAMDLMRKIAALAVAAMEENGSTPRIRTHDGPGLHH